MKRRDKEPLRLLTRREYFAGCALTSVLIWHGLPRERDRAAIVDLAWELADAMIESAGEVDNGEPPPASTPAPTPRRRK